MSRSNDSAAQQPELVEVRLAQPHTHKGQQKKAGETITVTAERKTWLEAQGVVGGTQQEESSNG
ncbi:hypothetical protein E8E95_05760 [Pseudomonas sp. BN414]|uniref:DUF7210 family protein n=1 Tax=Pseudomonas sp. BN414 TaxID=2567888 RepID=UPI002458F68B|nr:hypothetical protein [Pseudomonas sp. BN414]MDH4566179.1 hypothetical protein [Pseudomonas sp. BN414]